MEKKDLIIGGIVLAVINAVTSLGLFVTYPQMSAYAVSRNEFDMVIARLDRIEGKLDKLFKFN